MTRSTSRWGRAVRGRGLGEHSPQELRVLGLQEDPADHERAGRRRYDSAFASAANSAPNAAADRAALLCRP